MDLTELLQLARSHRHGVQASVSSSGGPQAALVGYVITDALEIFFDTVRTSRKHANLRRSPRAAFVIGADGDPFTIQLEGTVDEPEGETLTALQTLYFASFPDGPSRLAWPEITYVRITPTWVRLSDYRDGERITELTGDALGAMISPVHFASTEHP